MSFDWRPFGQREKVSCVLARQVRDRSNDALLPQQSIRKRRDITHMDTRAHDRPTRHDVRERCEEAFSLLAVPKDD